MSCKSEGETETRKVLTISVVKWMCDFYGLNTGSWALLFDHLSTTWLMSILIVTPIEVSITIPCMGSSLLMIRCSTLIGLGCYGSGISWWPSYLSSHGAQLLWLERIDELMDLQLCRIRCWDRHQINDSDTHPPWAGIRQGE